jgi:molecular chaperone DnaJ
MALRDYYVVLGVTRSATPSEIRDAYREQAKALHPDLAGKAGTAPFQELSEAYSTLSDPTRRREYDQAVDAGREGPRPAPSPPPGLVREPLSMLHGQARYQPSWEAIRERFLRNFTGIDVSKGELAQGLNVEVVLSAEEAVRGVVLPLEVPTFAVCPFCDGTGHDWEFSCVSCGGEGSVERPETVGLRIPPRVRPGSVFEIALDRQGVHNFYLWVHVFVDDRLYS